MLLTTASIDMDKVKFFDIANIDIKRSGKDFQ